MAADAFLFYDTIDCLLEKISGSLIEGGANPLRKISKEHLLELESLFGQALLSRALQLVHDDKKPIKVYLTANAVSRLYEVPGSKYPAIYKIFPGINFCSCESFRYWVLQNRHQATCKHVLAVWLATSLGRIQEETVSEKAFQQLKADLIKERCSSIGGFTAGAGPSKRST
ncbi:zinc finger SWIM domain-containing protein 7-like isoform X2 [Uranotaenia lowii]|uniref:zinc finger SWIM domain-containing protein 7-like isoform X2 n=1 Tax=Uranotaenia lowii TaxID=190385 RepID=UPI00247AB0C3|nr:zinc finger SWIM domain-containing protein 7-like isoform X2 [Uranotaenia lowii]